MRRSRSLPFWITLLWLLVLLAQLRLWQPQVAEAHSEPLDIARLDAYVAEQVQRHSLPGVAISIVEGDQIALVKGYGRADGAGRLVTAQTPFLQASVSKPLTALAVMQLVETGQVDLDAPVQRYVADFRVVDPVASAQITVRHLLYHTSGIPVTACDTRARAETLAQFVAELRTVELAAPPGARHIYCSGNYNLLGRVVEAVTGQPFASYVQRELFAPLAMQHSYTSVEEARRNGMAQGFRWFFGAPVPAELRDNPSQLPSGYLIASAEDMAHVLVAQLNGGRYGTAAVLSADGIAAMQRPGVPTGKGDGSSYGMGWVVGPIGGVPTIHHSGANASYHTLLLIEPATRRGVALLVNTFGLLASISAFQELEVGIVRLLAGEPLAGSPALSLPTLYLAVDAVLTSLTAWPYGPSSGYNTGTRACNSSGASATSDESGLVHD